MEDETPQGDIPARLEKLEKEIRGVRRFVTTLETGHEARAKAWAKKLGEVDAELEKLRIAFRKTKKKVKKLKH